MGGYSSPAVDITNLLAAIGALNSEGIGRTQVSTAVSVGVLGSFVPVVAAAAHAVIGFSGSVSCGGSDPGLAKKLRLVIAAGAGGAEVVKVSHFFQCDLASIVTVIPYTPIDASLFPKGTRVSIALANDTDNGNAAPFFSFNLSEKND